MSRQYETLPLARQIAPALAHWTASLGTHAPGFFETFTAGFQAREAEIHAADLLADRLDAALAAEAALDPTGALARALAHYRQQRQPPPIG